MSQYSLHRNYIRLSIPCSTLPQDDYNVIQLIQRLVKEHTHQEWNPDEKYRLMNTQGDSIVYEKGIIYRMSDSNDKQ
jgi:hypothetical protein